MQNIKLKSTPLFYIFIGILIGTLFPIQSIFAQIPIKLIINGQQVQCDVPPQNINGRVLVPARYVAENLGAEVTWDGINNAVVINSKVGQNQNIKQNNNVQTVPKIENTKSVDTNSYIDQVETLKDYYIQGDVFCIRYNKIVYTPVLAGMDYYKIPADDSEITYNMNKSVTFIKLNKTYYAGSIENNDDLIYYQGRIYIKESILKAMAN